MAKQEAKSIALSARQRVAGRDQLAADALPLRGRVDSDRRQVDRAHILAKQPDGVRHKQYMADHPPIQLGHQRQLRVEGWVVALQSHDQWLGRALAER